jgi:hypothetical protein
VLAGEAHNTKVLVFSVKGEGLLPFVFADAQDERAQYTMLIGPGRGAATRPTEYRAVRKMTLRA